MKRLDDFLFEYHNERRLKGKEHRSVPISQEEFLQLRDKNCKKAKRKNATKLYRGIEGGIDDYLFIDPSEHTRVSQYTANWYMLLMELSPQWEEFPKFSKSVIMTTDSGNISRWGREYRVYPYDGAILGVTPKGHFWGSFPYDMSTFNSFIYFIIQSFGGDIDKNETNPNVLKKEFAKIDKVKNIGQRKELLFDVDEWIERNCFSRTSNIFEKATERLRDRDKALDVFGDLLSTDGFLSKKIGDTLPNDKEVWTDSPCILEKINFDNNNEEE
jgi:hypothetical protein